MILAFNPSSGAAVGAGRLRGGEAEAGGAVVCDTATFH